MTVKKFSATTISIVIITACIIIFLPIVLRNNFTEILRIMNVRFMLIKRQGDYHLSVLSIAIAIIAITCFFDAILHNRVALMLFASFNIPLFLSILLIIISYIQQINSSIYLIALYVILVLGIYWSYRKIISNNIPGGLSLIRFFKTFTSSVGTGSGHIADRIIVFIMSLICAVYFFILSAALIIYAISYIITFLH